VRMIADVQPAAHVLRQGGRPLQACFLAFWHIWFRQGNLHSLHIFFGTCDRTLDFETGRVSESSYRREEVQYLLWTAAVQKLRL